MPCLKSFLISYWFFWRKKENRLYICIMQNFGFDSKNPCNCLYLFKVAVFFPILMWLLVRSVVKFWKNTDMVKTCIHALNNLKHFFQIIWIWSTEQTYYIYLNLGRTWVGGNYLTQLSLVFCVIYWTQLDITFQTYG